MTVGRGNLLAGYNPLAQYSGIVIALGLLLLAGCSQHPSSPESEDSPELSIPFERYTLDNGLTVILHEDHSDPVVHVDVTYHVGSAREEIGRSGFAHLFEHMMFQGSEHVADEEHIRLVTEAGGTMNGTTNRDRTNYFETVPANHLETMLWLEADRMGFFINGITEEKFEVQRATVKNEKQQNYDNRAYGRAFEYIGKTLYPPGHPYSWLPIGEMEDLDRAHVDDLQHFFLRWYGPNNATLSIGGDINPDEVKKLVQKYFGSIQAGPDVQDMSPMPVELDEDRYISYYDANIRFPAVTMTFPTVPQFHPDAPALRCLADILGSGKGSYLYQNLVAPRKAIQASASNITQELAGEFFMFVLPYPGTPLNTFEQELRQALSDFETNGVSDDDLQKFKARYETNFIHGLEKVSGKVSQLAYYQTFADDPAFFEEELQRHLAVTKEDVMRVYETYIKGEPSVIVSILDAPDTAAAKPDTVSLPAPLPPSSLSEREQDLAYVRPVDDFDRSIQPQPGPAALVSPPDYWESQASNGISVIGSEQNELPLIVMQLSLPGGTSLDLLDGHHVGLAGVSTAMMNTSTQNFSEKAIAEELEKLGSSIWFQADGQRINIYVSSLSRHFDETLALLEEKLFRPAFNEDDFARIQHEQIESAKSSTKEAATIAPMVYSRLIYGDSHPFGTPATFAIDSLPKLSPADAQAFYEKHFSPDGAELVIVGDIDRQAALDKLRFLFEWEGPSAPELSYPATPAYEATQLYLVDKPGAAQSEIRIGYLTDLSYDATGEYFRRYLMNFTLGGAFNSRINLNLREEKGLTYGARTYFSGSEIPGPFTASTSVLTSGTAVAVEEILKEIRLMREQGISESELHFLKQAIGQRDALDYESTDQKSRFLGQILRFDIERGYVDKQKAIIDEISQADILALAQKHLPLTRMQILVVGDAAQIREPLQSLGYPIVELSEDGATLE